MSARDMWVITGAGEMISGKWKQCDVGGERGGGVLCEENIMQLTADITPHSSGVLVDLW